MPGRVEAQLDEGREASGLESQEPERAATGIVSQDRFKEVIRGLRESVTIRNDKGEEVSFEGEAKDVFIGLFQKAYPVMGTMMQSLYETGHLLSEVRKELKPRRLFLTWIRFTGIPERTAYNYLRIYEGFGEQLPQLSHLGIKRLLIASRAPNCVEYVQDNEEIIAKEPAEELEKRIKTLRATRKRKAGGRKAIYVEVGEFKVRPSSDGTKILIEGLTKKRQEEMLEGIKGLLSQVKE